ncbi:MAG: hypothetical protein EPO07_12495 [Verrucomicrobia bacterium]|nr:MAG: hypothetical protein EPO07_12495 [Verrucomicrobiota bacterium]
MNMILSRRLIPLTLVLAALTQPLLAEELVTIPKARLQELESKEAQLEKLKKELGQTQAERKQLADEQQRLKSEAEQSKKAQQKAEAEAAAAKVAVAKAEPVIDHATPPMNTLPPLQKGEVVNAMDLMNHYRADAAAAKQRYEGQVIRLQGEVIGFSKPLFIRPYAVYLKTTERQWKVECNVHPPEVYSAIFTTKGGDEIVGSTSGGARTTIARVGQKVALEGRCKGLSDQTISLSGCALLEVK